MGTPPVPVLRVLFKVAKNRALIEDYSEQGVVVEVDDSKQYACISFNNTIDYNKCKKLIVI